MFEPGTWYFDTRDRALVYIVRFPSQFVTPLRGRRAPASPSKRITRTSITTAVSIPGGIWCAG